MSGYSLEKASSPLSLLRPNLNRVKPRGKMSAGKGEPEKERESEGTGRKVKVGKRAGSANKVPAPQWKDRT